MQQPQQRRRNVAALVAGAALAIGASFAVAQTVAPAKVEDAIKYRQSALFVMGQHMAPLAAMVRGDRPWDQGAAVAHAQVVNSMAQLPWTAFTPGSDKGGNTRAKPEIWSDNAKFQAAAKRLTDATATLVTATKSGDQAAFKTAFGGVGGACKNCHEGFRTQ